MFVIGLFYFFFLQLCIWLAFKILDDFLGLGGEISQSLQGIGDELELSLLDSLLEGVELLELSADDLRAGLSDWFLASWAAHEAE